jgi:hypothetical protein
LRGSVRLRLPDRRLETHVSGNPTPALLLIGDIGGYTRFMRLHRLSLAHSQEIIGRLLAAVAEAADEVELVEFEGDAAFFYAQEADVADPALAQLAAREAIAMHRAFHSERQRMEALNMCNCDACRQIGDLKVKFVVHAGEVAVQTIRGKTNVFGADAIAVHQMLKNSVPVPEYLLMTDTVFSQAEPALRARARSIEQELEGLGAAEVHFVDLGELAAELPSPPQSTYRKRVAVTLGVIVRGMPYLLRGTRRDDE